MGKEEVRIELGRDTLVLGERTTVVSREGNGSPASNGGRGKQKRPPSSKTTLALPTRQ